MFCQLTSAHVQICESILVLTKRILPDSASSAVRRKVRYYRVGQTQLFY
jgi:hypothetical protein